MYLGFMSNFVIYYEYICVFGEFGGILVYLDMLIVVRTLDKCLTCHHALFSLCTLSVSTTTFVFARLRDLVVVLPCHVYCYNLSSS